MSTIQLSRYYVDITSGVARIIEVVRAPHGLGTRAHMHQLDEISREPVHTGLTPEYADLLCAMLNKRGVAFYYAGRIDFMQHASVGNLGERSYMENINSQGGAICIPAY
jgi:hypothetical protein